LNVYDVSCQELLQKINRVFTANNQVLVGGVFHAGVEVYGREYHYGATEDERTGVGFIVPRLNPQHTYRATVPMGTTALNKEDVHCLILEMVLRWRGPAYNLIHNNCLDFANAFLAELGLRRIPGWVDRAQRTAVSLTTAVEVARSISAEDVQSQAAEALENLRRDSAKVLEKVRLGEPLFDEAQVQQVQAKAAEIGERAQESMQALGASLWQWGQDLSGNTGAGGGDGEKIGEKAQALKASFLEWGQEVQKTAQLGLGIEAPQERRRPTPKDGATGILAEEKRGTAGMIRAAEDNVIRQGLLADDDEDDLFAQSWRDAAPAPLAAAPTRAPKVAPQIQEAPAEWLSMVSTGPVTAPAAGRPTNSVGSAPGTVDLLSGDLAAPGPALAPESSSNGNLAWTAADLLS
jgi:hypothetical protein